MVPAGKVRWESTWQAITRDKKSSGDRNGNFGTSEKKVPAELLGFPSLDTSLTVIFIFTIVP